MDLLTHISFTNFGKISHDFLNELHSPLDLTINEHKINSKTMSFFYCTCDSDTVIINPMFGTPLLCVSKNLKESEAHFYLLDKPVILNKNIYYNILSLYGECKVQIVSNKLDSYKEYNLEVPIIYDDLYPKIEIDKIFTLFYQEKKPGFNFKGEKHCFYELTYVDYGVLNTSIDDKVFTLNQGEAIFYMKNQYHSQWSNKDKNVCFVTITFLMEYEHADFLKNKIFSFDNPLTDLVKKIIFEHEKSNYTLYSNDLIICYLKEIIILLIRKHKEENNSKLQLNSPIHERTANSIVLSIINYINSNIINKITLKDISEEVHLSSSYLSKIFKTYLGVTITYYINNLRLEKSKELIRSTNNNITQISEMCGFKSIHYFSKIFKVKFGMTPSDYARTIRN
jgi:AraC-like DNA-binding protein